MGANRTAAAATTLEPHIGSDASAGTRSRGWIVILAACVVFLSGVISPPHLMDDVDAVQVQIARNMLSSGDWVTARLDGVAYLEKSPLIYWMMSGSFRLFGVHDWAARLPLALSAVLLCWVVYRFGRWAFGEDTGLCSGLALATSCGLYLFTRIQIPDAMLTVTIAGALWAWLYLLEPDTRSGGWLACVLGVCLGLGLLLKGLIAVVFPLGACLAYMAATQQLFSWSAWRRLRPGLAIVVTLAVAAPWHIIATLRNPPYLVFSMHSGPGMYRGFFWFYFFNEHLLRFLNLRYPRDYNTVPRLWFWLLNLVWLFPWSVYLPGAIGLSYRPDSRAGRVRLMALCWIGFVMVFFTFSTTQEYYSMPIYPALALLIGSAIAAGRPIVRRGTAALVFLTAALSILLAVVLALVWNVPARGELADALARNSDLYTLSLGHMFDLTLAGFAFLKLPLGLAAASFAFAAAGIFIVQNNRRQVAIVLAAAMALFFQASRIALVRFDSYLGSYPLAEKLNQSPPGRLIEANAYYAFSSVFFYTNRTALLLNGRFNNLEYGSWAPDAPQVFIGDAEFKPLWNGPDRYYLVVRGSSLSHLQQLAGERNFYTLAESSGNYLLTNHR